MFDRSVIVDELRPVRILRVLAWLLPARSTSLRQLYLLPLWAGILCSIVLEQSTSGQNVPMRTLVPGSMVVPAPGIPAEVLRASAAGSESGDQANQETDGTTDAQAVDPQVEQRIQMLLQLPLSRVPSQIFETWKLDQQKQEVADEGQLADGLPPAPFEANLLSDERFQQYQAELRRNFALGNWERVAHAIKLLPTQYQVPMFDKLIATLALPPGGDPETQNQIQQQQQGVDQRVLENQAFALDDLLEIAQRYPQQPLPDSLLEQLGAIGQSYVARGFDKQDLRDKLRYEVDKTTGNWLTARQAAKILAAAGQLELMVDFVPDVSSCLAQKDYEALNLHARIVMAIHAREKKTVHLERAWEITQMVLAGDDVPVSQTNQALQRAITLASQVREELGQSWLQQSFGEQYRRGLRILATIAEDTAKSMMTLALQPDERLKRLRLQNEAVNALLKYNEEIASENPDMLAWIADNWLRESKVTYTDDESNTLSPSMRRDMYGNMFYYNPYEDQDYYQYRFGYRQLQPIKINELLEIKPSSQWLDLLPTEFRTQLDISLAKLYLKVEEESLCFPHIEKVAQSNREVAKELVQEYLRVWTKNHDPNAQNQRRNNYYMYMYGFESRAESIPLTRSKQQRNLRELSELIPKLKALNLGELDQDLIVNAFLTCHSYAEVYQVAEIESILGPLSEIKPKLIANLAQRMRSNLAGVWREMEVQKQAKTKRSKSDLEAEVLNGYKLAGQVVEQSLALHPQDWSLLLVQATLKHDENNYRSDLKNRSDYATIRRDAFALFQQAAQAYASKVHELEEQEYSTEVYEHWLYAALGASDLNLITEKHQTDLTQPPLIRDAINALPPAAAAWHLRRFASLLFDRTSAVQPHSKFRYLKSGFEVVGDHPQARQAKAVFDYYQDLVTEIKLDLQLDGTAQVGTEPFGVFVNLKHTKEIERESGGFGKYLQNQNQGRQFFYNYGRPLEDYRDKFEEYVRQVMSENFEVLSVTFQVPEVKSRPTNEEGWRLTPYAYLLLKSRGPEVDKVPAVKVDFDFLDVTGYSILPVESPALAIASNGTPQPRPARDVNVTQILDERRNQEGKLIVEIKATANGLVPDFEQLFATWSPENFEMSVEDQGVSVSRFNPDVDDNVVSSDRTWLVTLTAKEGTMEAPQQFAFPTPDYPVNEVVYQRYKDADLEMVEATVGLAGRYVEPDYSRYWWSAAAAALCGLGLVSLLIGWKMRTPQPVTTTTGVPEQWTPFTALAVLERLHESAGLAPGQQQQIRESMQQLESYYFRNQRHVSAPPDVNRIMQPWLRYVAQQAATSVDRG